MSQGSWELSARPLFFSVRLEQNLAVPGCVRRAWWVLQRRGSSSFWRRRRRWQETGECHFMLGHSWKLAGASSCWWASLRTYFHNYAFFHTVCWQIHSEGWLWEGRRSGAHSEERGDGGADQAGGRWTVVRKQPQGNLQGMKIDILAAVRHLFVLYCRLVRNLSTSKEGTIRAANLMSLIGKSKSCQSLTSSGS